MGPFRRVWCNPSPGPKCRLRSDSGSDVRFAFARSLRNRLLRIQIGWTSPPFPAQRAQKQDRSSTALARLESTQERVCARRPLAAWTTSGPASAAQVAVTSS